METVRIDVAVFKFHLDAGVEGMVLEELRIKADRTIDTFVVLERLLLLVSRFIPQPSTRTASTPGISCWFTSMLERALP